MAGSVSKDKKTGKWYYVLEIGRDDDGKRLQKKKRGFKTQGEAKLALAKAETELASGTYIEPTKLTFSDYAAIWLESRRGNIRDDTIASYAYYLENYIKPYIGALKLDNIKPTHVEKIINKLRNERELSPSTVAKSIATLNTVMKKAVTTRIIKENPVTFAEKPKLDKYQATVWNQEQINEFVSNAKFSYYYVGFLITILTGMRRSEVLALRWSDADLENGILHVRQSLSNNGKFEKGKNTSSLRSVYIPSILVDELKVHKQKMDGLKITKSETWNKYDLIICSRNGNPVDKDTFGKSFRDLIKKLKLPHIRFHDLRHSHATSLINQNVNFKIISDRLGHSTIGTTMNIYGHVLPEQKRSVADLLDNIIENK